MNKKLDTKRLVLLAVLAGILLVMSFTPIGYLNIGPLAISLNRWPLVQSRWDLPGAPCLVLFLELPAACNV